MDAEKKTSELLRPNAKKQSLPTLSIFHPLSRRLHVLLLIMIGYFAMVYMRTNFGFTMTCMVNSTAIALKAPVESEIDDEVKAIPVQREIPEKCRRVDQQGTPSYVNDYGGNLDWGPGVQASLFSANFYGSIVSIVPAGIMADRYSPKRLLQLAGVMTVLCTVTMPYLAENFGFPAAFGSMFLMGVSEGFILPSINKMLNKWVPTEELSTAASIYTTGNQMAGGIGAPLAAFLCATRFKWPAIFYACGLIAAVWVLVWTLCVTDTPGQSKLMTRRERQYLNRKLASSTRVNRNDRSDKSTSIPYMKMMTSLPLWALLLCTLSANMIVVLIQAYLPQFFKEVLFLSMMSNGFYSAALNVSQLIVKMVWSMAMDKLKKGRLSTTTTVKISQGFSSFSVGIIFVTLAWVADCERPVIALLLLCLMTMCFSTAISGFYTSLLSLAPPYTGTLTSISMICGYGSMAEWTMIFYFMAVTAIGSGLLFLVFGSGSEQEWGRTSEIPTALTVEDESRQARRRQRLESHVGSVVLDLLD